MKTFWQITEDIGGPPGGAPAPGGPPPGGDPMGGLPGGMGGGGMPPGGAMGGMPPGGGMGAPMGGGGMGGGQEPSIQIKPMTVWEVLNRILDGKKIETKKPPGQDNQDMLQGGQPQEPSPPPASPAPPMGAPLLGHLHNSPQ